MSLTSKARVMNIFFKGPITSCEYVSNDKLLIGSGPYLSLIDDDSFDEMAKILALKYRVIHKSVQNASQPNLVCVFGQKAFSLVKLNSDFTNLELTSSPVVELDDWIFDIVYLSVDHLAIVCAHNQYILFGLKESRVVKKVECVQKCML